MSDHTAIAWTRYTFNLWIGCTRVSPACDFCYAATLSEKWGWATWGRGMLRKIMSPVYWKQPRRWNRQAAKAGVRRRVFCASLADVFDAERPELLEPERQKLWQLIRETPMLDWQLLTKRSNLIRKFYPADLVGAPNVWLGTSVESALYTWRIKELIETPAVVHFLSVEPLLGPLPRLPLAGIDWVIVGGESGDQMIKGDKIELALRRAIVHKVNGKWVPKPEGLAWVREIRDQCVAAGVAFFFKQWGGPKPTSGGRMLDGREWSEFPMVAVPRTPVILERHRLVALP